MQVRESIHLQSEEMLPYSWYRQHTEENHNYILRYAIQQNCIVSPSATYRDMSQHHHHHPCTQCKLQYRSGPSLLLVTSENVLALGYHSDVLYHPTAGPDGQLCPLVLVVYTFEGAPEHDVLVRPHSSLKSNKPYCRTVKSVQEHLAKEVAIQSPKKAVRTVFAAKGGLKGAQSQGSLPMIPKQAYNISQKVKNGRRSNSEQGERTRLTVSCDGAAQVI